MSGAAAGRHHDLLRAEGGGEERETTGQALTLAAPGDTGNVKLAVAAVGLVTAGVNLALLWPRTFIAGVIEHPAHAGRRRLGLEAHLPAPRLGRQPARLAGLGPPGHRDAVTGLKPDNSSYQSFVWYTGDHGAKEGKWSVFAQGQTGPVLTIDWAAADDDKQLTFTNVTTGQDGSGDRLGYSIKGKIATMAIHDAKNDAGQPADSSVVWSVENGSGKLTAPAATLCWDTLANGQVNLPCPAGDWPTP